MRGLRRGEEERRGRGGGRGREGGGRRTRRTLLTGLATSSERGEDFCLDGGERELRRTPQLFGFGVFFVRFVLLEGPPPVLNVGG